MTNRLEISEVVGPTFAFDGPYQGTQRVFLAVAPCDPSCGECEVPIERDPQLRSESVGSVIEQINAIGVPRVAMGGGEPMAHQAQLLPLLETLGEGDTRIEVETSGNHAPYDPFAFYVDHFAVSPSLSRPVRDILKRNNTLSILNETGRASFRFQIRNRGDFDQVEEITAACGIEPENVWVASSGSDAAEVRAGAQTILLETLENGWNFSARLDVLLWEPLNSSK